MVIRPLLQRSTQLGRQLNLQEALSGGSCGRTLQFLPSLLAVVNGSNPYDTRRLRRPGCLDCRIAVLHLGQRRLYSIDTSRSNNGKEKTSALATPSSASDSSTEAETATASQEAALILPTMDIKNLPSEKESRRTDLSKKFSKFMNDVQGTIFIAGRRLNDLTGYAAIDKMKKAIEAQEEHVRATRAEVRAAKEAYTAAINCRSASQREVNELLQRKHAWTSSDLERFTSLYRSDHANEQAELASQERLARAERLADEAQSVLTKSILTRYHEEQIWSDKIRSASTWVTWALMGFNVFLFVIVQLGLEPWRRRRLVRGFEEKVREALQEETLRSALLRLEVDREGEGGGPVIVGGGAHATVQTPAQIQVPVKAVEGIISEPIEGIVPEMIPPAEITAAATTVDSARHEGVATESEQQTTLAPELFGAESEEAASLGQRLSYKPETYKNTLASLFSEQVVSIRRRDLTTVALESAATGALLTAAVAFLLNR